MTSLQRLHTSQLDAFLLHRASDLLSTDGEELLYWLESLRHRGLVKRIGVSIYEASDLEGLPLDRLQLVQLPLSVYDQRLISDGTISKLRVWVCLYVRSVLLQDCCFSILNIGLIIVIEFRTHHDRWIKHLHHLGLSPLSAALAFVRACKGLRLFSLVCFQSRSWHSF